MILGKKKKQIAKKPILKNFNKELFFAIILVLFLFVFSLANGGISITGEAKAAVVKVKPQCNDGIDNDGDGYCDVKSRWTKCTDGSKPGDPDCRSRYDNKEAADCIPSTEICDGLDNNCNGQIDENLQIRCSSATDCGATGWNGSTYCGSDGNAHRDWVNYQCNYPGKCSSSCSSQSVDYVYATCPYGCLNGACLPAQCGDAIDNDADGLADYPNDPGCLNSTDNDEYNIPATNQTGTCSLCSSTTAGSEYRCDSSGAYNSNGFYICTCTKDYTTECTYNGNDVCDTGETSACETRDCGSAVQKANCVTACVYKVCYWNFTYACDANKDYGSQYVCNCYSGENCRATVCGNGVCENTTGENFASENKINCPLDCEASAPPPENSCSDCKLRTAGSGYRCDFGGAFNSNGAYWCECTKNFALDCTYTGQCNDKIDNDGDGKIDYPADPGCASALDADEYNAQITNQTFCGDGTCNGAETCSTCAQDCGACQTNLSGTVRITTDPKQQTNPKISGNYIVWWDDRNVVSGYVNTDIYGYDLSTGSEIRLTNALPKLCSGNSCPANNPTLDSEASAQNNPDIYGSKVVYSDASHVCYSGGYWGSCDDIYMYDFATGQNSLVSSKTTRQLYPRIQGNGVVWFETGTSSGNYEIYYRDLSTGQETYVGIGSYPDIYGSKIVYMPAPGSPYWGSYGNATIRVYDTKTGNYSSISAISQSTLPKIYGNKVAYEDYVNGWVVFVYDFSTGQKKQLTTIGDSYGRNPAIYNNKVVYQDSRNGTDLYVYDLSTSKETLVERAPSYQMNPDIDGNRLVYKDGRNGNPDVYISFIN